MNETSTSSASASLSPETALYAPSVEIVHPPGLRRRLSALSLTKSKQQRSSVVVLTDEKAANETTTTPVSATTTRSALSHSTITGSSSPSRSSTSKSTCSGSASLVLAKNTQPQQPRPQPQPCNTKAAKSAVAAAVPSLQHVHTALNDEEGQEALWVGGDALSPRSTSSNRSSSRLRRGGGGGWASSSPAAKQNQGSSSPFLANAAEDATGAVAQQPHPRHRFWNSKPTTLSSQPVVTAAKDTNDFVALGHTTKKDTMVVAPLLTRAKTSNAAAAGGWFRSRSATAAQPKVVLLPSNHATTTPLLLSPTAIAASDTISSLGFDPSLDDCSCPEPTKKKTTTTISTTGSSSSCHNHTSPLSMSSLNAILDGPISPDAVAAPSHMVILAHSKKTKWVPTSWKRPRRSASLPPPPMQRYSATVLPLGETDDRKDDVDDDYDDDVLSLRSIQEKIGQALLDEDNEDAQSLTSYEGVPLHNAPSSPVVSSHRPTKTTKNITTTTIPLEDLPRRGTAAATTFVAALSPQESERQWESLHQHMLSLSQEEEEQQPSPAQESRSEDNSSMSNKDAGSPGSNSEENPAAKVPVSSPPTPLKLLTSPASSTATSVDDRYSVAADRPLVARSYSDDDEDKSKNDKYSIDPMALLCLTTSSPTCSLCESLWSTSPTTAANNKAAAIENDKAVLDKYAEIPDVVAANSSGSANTNTIGERYHSVDEDEDSRHIKTNKLTLPWNKKNKSSLSPLRQSTTTTSSNNNGLWEKLQPKKWSTPPRRQLRRKDSGTARSLSPHRYSTNNSIGGGSATPPTSTTDMGILRHRSQGPVWTKSASPGTVSSLPVLAAMPTPQKSILKVKKRPMMVDNIENKSLPFVPPPSIQRYHSQQLLETSGTDRVTVITINAPVDGGEDDALKNSQTYPTVEDASTGSSSAAEEEPTRAPHRRTSLVDHIEKRMYRPKRGMDPLSAGDEVMGRLQLDP